MGDYQSHGYIAIVVLIILVLIINAYFLINWFVREPKSKHARETFEIERDEDGNLKYQSNTIVSFLQNYGFSSLGELQSFLNGQYEEDVNNITEGDHLTFYFSIFSQKSMPSMQSKIWKNISPFDPPSAYDYLEFDDLPYFNRSNGFEILSNPIQGPPSHFLGIQGNGNFTLFFVLRFNAFLTHAREKPFVLFRIYGNTHTNNGLSIILDQASAQDKEKKKSKNGKSNMDISFRFYFGEQELTPNSDDSFFSVDTQTKYMLVITKENSKLSSQLHAVNQSFNSEPTTITTILPPQELHDLNLLFSNKPLEINPYGNLNVNLFALGFYKKMLDDVSSLHNHMYNELYKTTREFMRESRQMIQFGNEMDGLKVCPFDSNVCASCDEVRDWTQIEQVLNASEKCKKSIDTYCSQNTNHPKCSCWKPDNMTKSTCKSYVNVFRQKDLVDLGELENNQLEEMKQKHDLCPCKDIENYKCEYERIKALYEKSNKEGQEKEKEKEKESKTPILDSPHIDVDSRYALENNPSILDFPSPQAENKRYFNNPLTGYDKPDVARREMTTDDAMYNYDENRFEENKGFWAWLFGF